jgi:hypothetical protein
MTDSVHSDVAAALLGATEGDTLRVQECSGTYFPLESRWEGQQGKITWASAGFDPNKVYSTFGAHKIRFDDNEFVIEPATLHYAEKFNEPVEGKLTYRLLTGKSNRASEYPRFETYDNTLEVQNIMEGVQYIGGFTIKGQEIQGSGTSGQPARLLFFDRKGYQVAEARARQFLIRANEALSNTSEFFLCFQKDAM